MPRRPLEDARDRLLAAGLHLFARRGTERVNSNAIAKRAQLGVGTFYTHFANKYALLRELQLRTLAGLRAERASAVARAGPDARAQVEAVVGAAIDFAAAHPEAYRVTFGRERSGRAAGGPAVSESIRPTAEALRRLARRGRLDPALDPELAARAYLAMEVGTILWWLDDRRRTARADLVATLARLHPAIAAGRDASSGGPTSTASSGHPAQSAR